MWTAKLRLSSESELSTEACGVNVVKEGQIYTVLSTGLISQQSVCFLLSWWSLGFYRYSGYTSADPYNVWDLSMTSQPVRTKLPLLFFFCSPDLLTSSDRGQEKKKKTEALCFSFSVSPSCPSSFRLLVGSQTRQNERMWDRQPWNGGQGPWGVCDRVDVCVHLYFAYICLRYVCVHGKITKCFPVLLTCICTEIQHTYLFVHLSVFVSGGLNNKVENSFETRLHYFSPSVTPQSPPMLFHMNTNTHTHTHTHTPACLHLRTPQCHPDFRRNSFVYLAVRAVCCYNRITNMSWTDLMHSSMKWQKTEKWKHLHSLNSVLTFCNY